MFNRTRIYHLPPEVLREVFRYLVLSPRAFPRSDQASLSVSSDKRRRRPVWLSHVCSSWRDGVLSDPVLWTDVHIYGTSELYFDLFMERSRPHLVDLTIVVLGSRSAAGISDFLTRKVKEFGDDFDRIRSVNLFVDKLIPHGSDALITLRSQPLPALRSLLVHNASWRTTFAVQGLDGSCLPDVPTVERVSISATSLHLVPNRALLTTLEVHDIGWFGESYLEHLFESLPCLSTLILGNLNQRIPEPDPSGMEGEVIGTDTPIEAPKLLRLAIASPVFSKWDERQRSEPCSTTCLCGLKNLCAEKLEYVEVTGEYLDGLYHLVPVIEKHFKSPSLANQNQDHQKPLTLMLNGVDIQSPSDLKTRVTDIMPRTFDIDLHLYPKNYTQEWSQLSEDTLKTICQYHSVIVHLDLNTIQNVPRAFKRLLPNPNSPNLIPVLIYTAPEGSLSTHPVSSSSLPRDAPYLDLATVISTQSRLDALIANKTSTSPSWAHDDDDDETHFPDAYLEESAPELDDSLESDGINVEEASWYQEVWENGDDFADDESQEDCNYEGEMFSQAEPEFGEYF